MKIIKPVIEVEPYDGVKIMKKIERACRNCYRSEGSITEDSYKKLITNCINRHHESVLEHEKVTVRMTCDIGVYKDLTRHRIASFSIESTRYCVAGDTVLKFSNAHNKYTIKDLYELIQNSKNGQWKRMRIRQLNENTGELQYAYIKNVYRNGIKKCYKIKTDLNYELVCTDDHQIYTPNGYKKLKDLSTNDLIYVNGQMISEPLYRKCHQGVENKNLEILYADKIVSIEEVGFIEVYDIEMNSDFHNYSANGIIVHNCNYGKDKFDNEIKFIEPMFYDNSWIEANYEGEAFSDSQIKSKIWYDSMSDVEDMYMNMSKTGSKPDELRMLLPHSTAAQVYMTANIREWRHILRLRCSKMTHPAIQQVLIPLLLKFKQDMPELFEDVEYNTEFPKDKYAELKIMEEV